MTDDDDGDDGDDGDDDDDDDRDESGSCVVIGCQHPSASGFSCIYETCTPHNTFIVYMYTYTYIHIKIYMFTQASAAYKRFEHCLQNNMYNVHCTCCCMKHGRNSRYMHTLLNFFSNIC